MAKRAGVGKIPHRVGIEQGPAEVEERRHIRHWEGGTVLKGHKESGLVTLVERCSGYLLAARLSTITATRTAKAMTRLLTPCRGAVHSITLDNGPELVGHRKVAKAVWAKTFFATHIAHRQLKEQELKTAYVNPDMVRLTIGIEHIDDLLTDIDQALASSQG